MKHYSFEDRLWMWLNKRFGTSVATIESIVKKNGGILQLAENAIRRKIEFPDFISRENRHALQESFENESIDKFIEWLDSRKVTAVTRASDNYPNLLREIYDPPTVLYVVGNLKKDVQMPFAIIGSRKCTHYGLEMSERFGMELAEQGFCIVSGMAVGCDSAASKGALSVKNNDYPTIAVLGSGVNVIYPASSFDLYNSIAERGAVISELLPHLSPTRYSFQQRNRIISGLSKGVLVVEAGERSGTMLTVDFAHDQGRDVFSIPGRITDKKSYGTNQLIKNGCAKAVFDIDDILFEYGVSVKSEIKSVLHDVDTTELSEKQHRIYEALLNGEKNFDSLCEILRIPIPDLNMCLTEMELSGIIKQLSNGVYSV